MLNKFVSVHGGHSGEFCLHAKDRLEDIILRYIEKGFKWIGITEHIPAINNNFLYEDEKIIGITANELQNKFYTYLNKIDILKEKYKEKIKIYKSFEADYYTGIVEFIDRLKLDYTFDYILGSIHFVKDINFDYSVKFYDDSIMACKGIDNLYSRYFEEQYEMINLIRPNVVAHFDLIRIYDEDYKTRIKKREIWKKVERNLEFILKNNIVIDLNLRAFKKGFSEPYPSNYILSLIKEMGIKVYPGDDSHSVEDVGNYMDKAIEILHNHGFDTKLDYPFG